jgi:hypothetical protein
MMDYAIFMMENNVSVRERIWKQFCGILPNMKDFEAVFMRCTEDHKCLVVDCRSTSYKVHEMLYWYKASDRGTFRMGVPAVWDDTVDVKNRQLAERDPAGEPSSVASTVFKNREVRANARRGSRRSAASIGVQLRDIK